MLALIKEEIGSFLTSPNPEVLALYGGWGVGKTFLWKEIIKHKRSTMNLSEYAYVSLFGINSLEQLKTTIFENIVSRDAIGEKSPDVFTFLANLNSVISSKERGFWNKHAPKLAQIFMGIKTFSPVINSMINLSIKNLVICFDDMERKGESLTINEILGLISSLKQERNCKIALIFNEDKIESNDKGYLSELSEKVIDKRIELLLSPQECIEICFHTNDVNYEAIKAPIINLNIINIRLINIIKNLYDSIVRDIHDNLEEETLEQIGNMLCILSVCHYIKSTSIPNLDFLLNTKNPMSHIGQSKKDNEREQYQFLTINQFFWLGKLDRVIANGIKSGFFNSNELRTETVKLNEENKHKQLKDNSFNYWDLFHNSFENNEKAVIDSLCQGFITHIKVMSIRDADGLICLLRSLHKNNEADNIMSEYIKFLQKEHLIKKLNDSYLTDVATDVKFITEITALNEQLFPPLTLQEVIEYIASKKGWNPAHEVTLINASTEEFYTFFYNLKGDNLTNIIRTMVSG